MYTYIYNYKFNLFTNVIDLDINKYKVKSVTILKFPVINIHNK